MDKEPTQIKIEVDNNTIARFWLILLAILAGIGLVFWARQALVLVGIAVFLAIAINPLVNRLTSFKFFEKRRNFAVILAYLGLLAILLLFVIVFVPALIEQISNLMKQAPETVNRLLDSLAQSRLFENWDVESVRSSLLGLFDANKQKWLESLSGSLVSGIGSAASSMISVILTFVTSLLLSMELPSLKQYIFSFYRNKKQKEHHQNLLARMYAVIVGFVSGQLMVALINSLVSSVVILILSYIFPVPQGMIVLFGLVLLLGAIIPLFGSTIGLIITVLFMVLYSWQAALIFTIFYLIYQQIEGNIISPMIQSKRVALSALLILISITLGTFMFGILGAIIAIPLAGCAKILLENFITNRRH